MRMFAALTILMVLQDSTWGKIAPRMTWIKCPEDNFDRCLAVEFEKETDVALLHQVGENYQCAFKGHFVNAPDTRIFASSRTCLATEDATLSVSFVDTRSDQFMFEVNPQTGVTLSHSDERKDQMSRRKIGSATVDNLSNRIGLQFEEHETHEGVSNKPQSMKYPDYPSGGFVINLIVFYDDAFTKMAGGEYPYKGEHAAAKAEALAIVNHAETIYNWPTLKASINFNIEAIEHYPNTTSASIAELHYLRDHVLMHDTRSPNTFLFLGVDDLTDYWIGYGWVGVACFSDFNKGYRASVIEAYDSQLVTAETFAHMLAFSMGIDQDFYRDTGNDDIYYHRHCPSSNYSCTDIGGVMDEGYEVNKWTCCSNDDFAAYYNERVALDGYFCLPPVESEKCKDTASKNKCKKWKKKGKCSKDKFAKQCKKTCGKC